MYFEEQHKHGQDFIQLDDSGNEMSSAPTIPESLPAPTPKPKKKKRPMSSGDLHTTIAGVTAGAGAAAIVSSALAERPPSYAKTFLYTCTMLGVGALYLGVLYFLYQKVTALEKTIARTLGDIRDLMSHEEDQVMDETLPVEELSMEEPSASVEELSTPPSPVSAGPPPAKRKRSPKKQPKNTPPVLDLDEVAAPDSTSST